MTTGRGAWTSIGMEAGAHVYQVTSPRLGKRAANDYTVDPEAYDYRAVYYGVLAIQYRLKELGFYPYIPGGVYGRGTKRAVKKFQASVGIASDGAVGLTTAKFLFKPVVIANQVKYNIPINLLGGIVVAESIIDPGAVGYSTPADKGLSQFNTSDGNNSTWWNIEPADFTVADAFDYAWAIEECAKRLSYAKKRYAGKGTALHRKCMALQHNSPLWADKLYSTGSYPNDTAKEYVDKVLAAAAVF